MQINKTSDGVVIKYKDQTLRFGDGLQISPLKTTMRVIDETGNEIPSDRLVFLEINEMLETFSEEEKDNLWEIYTAANELALEDINVRHKHIRTLMSDVIKIFSIERFQNRFPMGSLWTPEDLAIDIDQIEVNHTREMTFIRSEYHQLVVFTLMLRPLIPMFMLMGIYQKGQSPSEKRATVDNRYRLMDAFERLPLNDLPIVAKLQEYIPEIVRRYNEEEESQYGSPNLYLTASIVGHGSDALDTYLLAYTFFNSLPYHSVAQKYQDKFVGTSVVVRVFRDVKAEISRGYVTRVSAIEVVEKPHAMKHTIAGDEAKLSVIDIVGARSTAPMEERIALEEYLEDYRLTLKFTGVDLKPAKVKMYIDNFINHPVAYYTDMHIFLMALALQTCDDVRNFYEVGPNYIEHGLGLAQAVYRGRGFPKLAALLSCSVSYQPRKQDYPFDPIPNDLKEKLSKYYPQKYPSNKRGKFECPALVSVQTFIQEHINQYEFTTNIGCPEVAESLGLKTGKQNLVPHEAMACELAEMMYLQAKSMWRHTDVRPVESTAYTEDL